MADAAAAAKQGSDFVAQLERRTCIRCGIASARSRRSSPRPRTRRCSGAGRTSSRSPSARCREVAIDDVERRALILANPAFGGETVTTRNLIAAFTVLDPGDRARPHRHTFAAIRFATRAEGAATIVNGRRCDMHEGDLILTPPMCWHGHINESDRRIIWFDAANMPLIRQLDANFFEPGDPKANQFWQVDEGDEKLWAESGMVGADVKHAPAHSPKYRYSGEATRRLLAALPAGPGRRAHAPLHQPGDRRRGDARARLLRGAAAEGPDDAAEAHHLQHDLPGGVRRGPLHGRRAHLRLVAARRVHDPALDLGQPHREGRRRRACSSSPTNRRSSGSTCCARNCNKPARENLRRRHRRVGPARRGPEVSARPGRLRRRHHVARRIALRAGALAACARPHPQHRQRDGGRPRPASSPCSPALTWPPTRSARWRRCGRSQTPDGKPMAEPPRWALARGTVRHVGEAVAAVIAETRAQAQDAADAVGGRLRAAARRHRRPRRHAQGRAATARRRARQCLLPLRAGRRSRGAQGVRRRGARGAARSRQQPADRRGDRAARGAGRRRRGQAHALLRRPRCRITSAAP